MANLRFVWVLASLLSATLAAAQAPESPQPPNPTRFEAAIEEFEAADKQHAPPDDPVVFVGSSSIRMWNLENSFPDLKSMNRGFGGSHIADTTHYLDRIVTKYRPRTVVFYAGDNDVNHGLTAETVAENFRVFHKALREALPATRLVYIAIKPSVARWKKYPSMRSANDMIKEQIAADQLATFVDIATPMLGDDGQPRAELFVADGLHLNKQGYQLWTKLIAPHLGADF